MNPRRSDGLQPLGAPTPAQAAEDRLRKAWPLLVGPALQRHARILRVKDGILVLGCWQLSLVPALRKAAGRAWPSLQERLQRATSIPLAGIEVVPCDPPQVPPPRIRPEDPFREVLERLRRRARRLGLDRPPSLG